MSHIKPLSETPESVTLSRADFDAVLEALDYAEDRMAVLEDCLLDQEPGHDRLLLSMADTMRIVDGASPVTVWRERRGLTVGQLAALVGVAEGELLTVEGGGPAEAALLARIAGILGVRAEMPRARRGL